jgi:hypothetical protein
VILAEDETSLYLQATVAQVWAPRRQAPRVRVDPQRDKTSFYGTLDLLSGREIVAQSPDTNGAATVEHLTHVLAAYPEGSTCSFLTGLPGTGVLWCASS